jgi:hypothetical protein
MNHMMTDRPFCWTAYLFNSNDTQLEAYDVLKYREKLVKQLKKTCTTKDDFKENLFKDFKHQYWSRCEYEMLISIEDGQVYAEPWPSSSYPDKYKINITDRTDFNWYSFAMYMINKKGCKRDVVKVDIYDQLKYREDAIADFCWNYRHKYQRAKADIR